MSDRSTVTMLGRAGVITLAAATFVGIGSSASAGSTDYPPIASIDPIVPTTTTPSGGTTATTGSDSTRSGVLLGAGALGLGGGLVAVSRRRRDASSAT